MPRAEPRLERRALQTTLRTCAHNTEHWLSRQLDTYLQDPDEVRTATRALMTQPGTIHYHPNRITVRIDPPDEPRVARAAHESPRTTKLYDRTSDEITLDEVERIAI